MASLRPRCILTIYMLNLLVVTMMERTLGATAAPLSTGRAVEAVTHATEAATVLDTALDLHKIKQACLSLDPEPVHMPLKIVRSGPNPESPGLDSNDADSNYDHSELLFPADLDFDRGRQVEFALSPEEHYASPEAVKRLIASRPLIDGTILVWGLVDRPRGDTKSFPE